ncbi:transposase [Caballeronia calidae]|uniref:transposase n=1 Tax=Caballeronia calidae TaxID=1777139 RepID=UPI002FCB5E95
MRVLNGNKIRHVLLPQGRRWFCRWNHVMGFRQFSLRGLTNVTAEWSLVALAWNIKRMNVLRRA